MGLPRAQAQADRSFPAWIERRRVKGVIVGLARGQETMVKSYGSSGAARPLAPDTLMEIGSITKAFTGALLADMTVRREVGLEDPIGRYLPVDTPRRDHRQITLLDLATHTSGLPRSGWALIRHSIRNRREPFAAYTVDDLYAAVAGARIRPGLGRRMAYSNIGYGLLGHILGLAAGRPYEDLVVDRVCRPLGLKDTTPDVPDPARAARGHRRDGRPVPPFRIPTLGAAGALRSTAVDMLAFLRGHLHPARTPFPEVVRLAIGPHRTFRRGRVGIGLGWLHLNRRDGAAIWHNGGTMGFGSFAAFDPGRDAAVVLLFNSRYLLRTARTALGLLGSLGE